MTRTELQPAGSGVERIARAASGAAYAGLGATGSRSRAGWLRALRALVWVGAALWLSASAGPVQGGESLKAGVVQVTATGPGVRRVGTGIVVRLEQNKVFILTAAHVVERSASTVEFYGQRHSLAQAHVVRLEPDSSDGLALLSVEGTLPPVVRALTFCEAGPIDEQPVHLIGFPRALATDWAIITGSLTGMQGRKLGFQAPALEGNSGGPLILKDKVVGVVMESAGPFGYAVSAITVRQVLQAWGIPIALEPCRRAELAGTWRNPANPALSYVFAQHGTRVSVEEIGRTERGQIVSAQGTGELDGRRLTLRLVTVFGDTGQAELVLSEDGQSMAGTYSDAQTGGSRVIMLSRSGD